MRRLARLPDRKAIAMTTSAEQPPPELDPESVHQVYLDADVRRVSRAATQQQLRDILHPISKHLCHQLAGDRGKVPALGPDRRRPWEVCQVGSAKVAGFHLYQQVFAAVAGSFLEVLGFDPAGARADAGYFTARVAPAVAAASKRQLRGMLFQLIDHMQAVLDDSDKFAQASAEIQAEVTGDLWQIAAGVSAAIGLYRHCARVLSVHVRYYILQSLGFADDPHYRPYAPGPVDPQLWPITFN